MYVETGVLDKPATLQFVTAGPDCRFVRISIRVPGRDRDLVAWLGHELQHAVELAGAPEVVDQDSLMRYYERIGMRRSAAAAETVAAQRAWRRILDEVKFGR